MADKSFWMHHALQQFAGRREEQEILEYGKQQGIVAETKSARRHWSGVSGFVWFVTTMDHPLDAPGATPNFKKAAYAADYYQTGSFVHCSVSAVDNYFAEEYMPFLISPSSDLHETNQSTLFIVLQYLHASIAYVLFGLGLERTAKLNDLFVKALNKMKPLGRRRRK